jgi:hypothetical protein
MATRRLRAPANPEPAVTDGQESTEVDYAAASEWAETATIDPDSPTIVRGKAAADIGRALMRSARAGRPTLDPNSQPGQESPVRRVRLPLSLNDQLNAFVAECRERGERVTPSDVVRAALTDYLETRRAS